MPLPVGSRPGEQSALQSPPPPPQPTQTIILSSVLMCFEEEVQFSPLRRVAFRIQSHTLVVCSENVISP